MMNDVSLRRRDRRVESIVSRLSPPVLEGRTEDGEVRALLVQISVDEERAKLHGQLLDAIEERFGTGQNGLAVEVMEDLRRRCEARGDRAQIESGDAEELKIGFWGPLAMGLIGAIMTALFRQDLPMKATVSIGVFLMTLVGVVFYLRARAHKRKRQSDAITMGMKALVGAIDRRAAQLTRR